MIDPALERCARAAVNFGFDADLTQELRLHHVEASNWRMGDFQAAAILMHWKLEWDGICCWMHVHDSEIMDISPFRRGSKGSIMNCLLEARRPCPGIEIKYYYVPLASRKDAPQAWRIFDSLQARPFHPCSPEAS